MSYLRVVIRNFILTALLLIGCLSLRAQDIPNPLTSGDLTCKTLANGLRLVVREDHSLPLVAMVVVVRAGSAVEPNTRGIAHYLEHLVYQGTKHYPGALAPENALEQVGGVCNAVTSRDMIRFQASVPSSQVDLLVNVLADVVLYPTLDEKSFAKERPVILAEIQQDDDNPLTTLMNHAYLRTYRTFPYRYTPTGSIDEVLGLTVSDVRAFYQRWYTPNNMSVVLVGDVTQARALQLAQQAFGAAKAAKLPELPAEEPAESSAAVRAHLPRNLPDTYQILAFPTPSSRNFSALVATDVVMTLLADGPDALLPAWWARDGVAVKRFGIEFISAHNPGRFLLWAQTESKMAVRLRESTRNLLRVLASSPIPPEELALAKQRLAGQFLLENETYTQQAATLAFYEGLGGAHLMSQYIPTLQSITAEQVQAALPSQLLGWVTSGQRPEDEP